MAEAKHDEEQSLIGQDQPAISSRQRLKVYHLSHDLRSPLNSILGFAELLKAGIEGPINEIQAEDLTAIHQSARDLLYLVDTLVDLSQLENDCLALTFEPVQLDIIIEHILATQNEKFPSKQIEFIATIPESLPLLWGDRYRVEQMVLSLVRFAISLTPKGQIHIDTFHDKRDVTIKIGINDVLMSPEQLEELFELTVEVNADGQSKLGIGGLDLPLTYQLAKKQAGQVWAESHKEIGTAFYLRLPLHQPT